MINNDRHKDRQWFLIALTGIFVGNSETARCPSEAIEIEMAYNGTCIGVKEQIREGKTVNLKEEICSFEQDLLRIRARYSGAMN